MVSASPWPPPPCSLHSRLWCHPLTEALESGCRSHCHKLSHATPVASSKWTSKDYQQPHTVVWHDPVNHIVRRRVVLTDRTCWWLLPTFCRCKRGCLAESMGVDHGGEDGGTSPPIIWSGGLSPQIMSCCKISSTELLALQCRKMCFCLYSRTFIVSPVMRPPRQNSSHIYAYGWETWQWKHSRKEELLL